jgi:hypothetical protein
MPTESSAASLAEQMDACSGSAVENEARKRVLAAIWQMARRIWARVL